jgi:hypothetical protein
MWFVQAQIQTVEAVYRLVSTAVATNSRSRPCTKGRLRWFCPHLLGRNRAGQLRVLCYHTLARARAVCASGFAGKLALCSVGETQPG